MELLKQWKFTGSINFLNCNYLWPTTEQIWDTLLIVEVSCPALERWVLEVSLKPSWAGGVAQVVERPYQASGPKFKPQYS
jgi:hypothetical protein